MTLKTTMSVLIAIILLPIVAGDAFAETDTPYKQFKNGIPLEDIQCRDSKILMETNRGTPACVNESSVVLLESKGFTKVTVVEFVSSDLQNIPEKYVYSSIDNTGGHGSDRLPSTQKTIEIPSSMQVGQITSIPYTISWYDSNGNYLCEPCDEYTEYTDKTFTRVFISVPEEFTVLNEDKKFLLKLADTYASHTATRYEIQVFHSTDPVSGSIDVRLDRPLHYDRDYFMIDGVYEFQLQQTDTGVTLVPVDDLVSAYDLLTYDILRNGYGPATITLDNGTSRHMENTMGRYNTLYREDVEHIPEIKTATQKVTPEPPENVYLEKHIWSGYADFLRNVIENGGNFVDYLGTPTFTQEFIDDFTQEYPEFRLQSVRASDGASAPIATNDTDVSPILNPNYTTILNLIPNNDKVTNLIQYSPE